MDWLLGWLEQFLSWLWGLIVDVLKTVTDVLYDFVVRVLDGVFGFLGDAIKAMPVPEFMDGGMQQLFNAIPPEVGWFVGQIGVVEACAILGSGVAFRLLRKAITLGQW